MRLPLGSSTEARHAATVRWVALGLVAVSMAASTVVPDAHAQRRRRPRPAAATEPADGTGRLSIDSTTEGAEIFVDDESRGTTPMRRPLTLEPGEHTVRAVRPGYTEFSDVVRVRAGQTTRVEIELIPVTAPLRVESNVAGAQVFVDGRFVGTTPLDTELLEGRRVVRVRRGGYYTQTRRVRAVAGEPITLDLRLVELPPDENPYLRRPPRPPSWYERPLVWVGVGAGALALAGGVALAVALASEEPSQGTEFCAGSPRCVTVDF
ncbi:MAG: PEGA domain-containing protein [Deltaproteobacteria bacterium]|nr:PEGA domain-containing protein [Deltaproteobacteria bacterium]